MKTTLPAVLAGHWTTMAGYEMAVRYAAMGRTDVAYGDRSDMELANDIFMVDRNSLDLIGFQTAAKERIRWLSAQLAVATQATWSADMAAAPAGFDQVYFLVRPRGIHPGRGVPFTPTVVTRLDDELFRADNHIDAVVWAKNGKVREGPTTNLLEADLEWRPLP